MLLSQLRVGTEMLIHLKIKTVTIISNKVISPICNAPISSGSVQSLLRVDDLHLPRRVSIVLSQCHDRSQTQDFPYGLPS